MDKIRRLSDNASHLQVCLSVCLYIVQCHLSVCLYNATFVSVLCLCSTRKVSYRVSWCSTPLAGAPGRGSPPSSWRRSLLTTTRWPGLSLPSIHHLRFKVLQIASIHLKSLQPTDKATNIQSNLDLFRWHQLLWNRTTPSCRPTPASSPLTSVSSSTTRFHRIPG